MVAAAGYLSIATHEFDQKHFTLAIQKCDAALTYNPQLGDAWVVKALALHELGEKEKALECLNKGAEVQPDNPLVYVNRGELNYQEKRLESAVADYTRLIELRPTEPDGYLRRAEVYRVLGRPEQAATDSEQAAKLKGKGQPRKDRKGSP